MSELKCGFAGAMEALSHIQSGDQALSDKVVNNKQEHQHQLAEVLSMMLTLKVNY